MSHPGVFVHIVTWNSAPYIGRCLDSVINQTGYLLSRNLYVHVSDNASSDGTPAIVRDAGNDVVLTENGANFGFCCGHNEGLLRFLASPFDYFLVLNPDVRLEPGALRDLVVAAEDDSACGMTCPKLLRANESLDPVHPPVLDAAGMRLTLDLRHLDRGSERPDTGVYGDKEYVFGASGACVLMKRAFINDMLIDDGAHGKIVQSIFPALELAKRDRPQLFDEAFFAYREDADLCWRMMGTGWKCTYVPSAVGYHKRVVLPQNRSRLPAELNLHSVRNRFLLQINNYSFNEQWISFVPGVLFRNVLVILGVLLFERTSIPAFVHLVRLWRRAFFIRRQNMRRRKELRKSAAVLT